ncbi:hypothetical protein COOONC_17835, partial [Cooperia oncophora]
LVYLASTTHEIQTTACFSGLKDRDVLSRSDPLCTVSQLTQLPNGKEKWKRLGHTEVVWNSLDPEFRPKNSMRLFLRGAAKNEIRDIRRGQFD